jgi:DNA polymerase I-like protein with 3'-5' exonuclease and polymerase domains
MLSVIETGEDPHTHTAHLMFKVDKDIIKKDAKLIGMEMDRDVILERRMAEFSPEIIYKLPASMSARQMGKKSNHGLNYDEGYNTFALSNEIEISESKRVIALYHSIYPGIHNWHEAVKRQLAKDRTLTNCFGRKIRFLDMWGDKLFKAAYSAIPQSSVGDCTNIGLCEIYDSDLTDLTGPVNLDTMGQVHDSVLLQIPMAFYPDTPEKKIAFDAIKERVYDMMSPELEYNARKFKIFTDSKIGFNWGGYHPEHNPQGLKEYE